MIAVTQAAEAATPKSCPSCGTRYSADALFCSLDGAPLTTSPGAVAAAAASDPYVGREILGHIEVRQLVGIGAMGRVYRAFQKGIDRDVAVKILHRELSANHMLVARFHREAKVASRLAHSNVVHVLLSGQLPDGALYIVMEYLDGPSLQTAVAEAGGSMPLPRALHIALQLCDAAGEAHAQGVVHRDLKPENVMLVKRGDDPDCVKVLDFGIARLNWGEQSMATAAGLIFGTARYISPEGARGEKVSSQGDVYSIATMLYQMLSGRTPFDGEQAVAVLVQQIHDPPAPLESIPCAAYVPEPIAAVVMQNLAKQADQRADDARAFGRSLLEAAVRSGLSPQDLFTRPSMLGTGPEPRTSVLPMPSVPRTQALPPEPPVGARTGAAKTAFEPPADVTVDPRSAPKTEVPEPARVPLAAPGSEGPRWLPAGETAPRPAPTQPPSGVDSTMDDQQPPVSARHAPLSTPAPGSTPLPFRGYRVPRTRGRIFAMILAGVLVGALGVAVAAYREGVLGGHAAPLDPIDAQTAARPLASPQPPASAPVDPGIPALASTRAAGVGSGGAPGAAHAIVDVSNARPAVGQPVDLAARIQGGNRPRVEGATFHIVGPGIPSGTQLDGTEDGSGIFRATFTFPRGGRFEVAFTARADGAALRAAHVIVVGDVKPLPAPPSPSSLGPPPAPTDGTRWL
jgi:eukaryotic-like serine/threonine-protein kinase